MSAELDTARQQVAKGDYTRAIDTLQRIRRRPVELNDVRGILEVARLIQQHEARGIVRMRVDRLIEEVEDAVARTLESDMGSASVDSDELKRDTTVYVSTTFDIPGFDIVEFHGPIFGLVVRSRDVFTNLGVSAKALVGGELQGLTRLLIEGRDEALRRLRAAARDKGANAVVGLRYDTSELGGSGNEVVAYGTAVTVRRAAGEQPTAP
jgi:uncharacterized protein YbjQ (UPF0145 family)